MQVTKTGHLSYCTNIHPGETWEEIFQNLQYALALKKELCAAQEPFGIGLRLSALAAEQLGTEEALFAFKKWLNTHNCYVFTMNGFPYGGFHNTAVKDQVHAPDWTTQERFVYTKLLFKQLAILLPEGQEGGVSTSPISYRFWHTSETELQEATKLGAKNMIELVKYLVHLKEETGKTLHLDIEPEPDGILENSDEFIKFYNQYLIQNGSAWLSETMGISIDQAKTHIYTHIQLCYDVCHFAVAFEEPSEVLDKITSHGIKIGKIQISAAIKTMLLNNANHRESVKQSLVPFNESTYLHQSVMQTEDRTLEKFKDLGPALEVLDTKTFTELRCHFHVPIFMNSYGTLQSTQNEILKVLDIWKQHPFTNHLEVETYTWEVLPKEHRLDLVESIRRELAWVKEIIAK